MILEETEDPKKEKEAMLLLYQVDQEPAFNALGFFSIDRSTLTSLLGTILTYLIVLVQFDQPAS